MSYKMTNWGKFMQMTNHHINGFKGIIIRTRDRNGEARLIFKFENYNDLNKWLEDEYREETKKDD